MSNIADDFKAIKEKMDKLDKPEEEKPTHTVDPEAMAKALAGMYGGMWGLGADPFPVWDTDDDEAIDASGVDLTTQGGSGKDGAIPEKFKEEKRLFDLFVTGEKWNLN